MTVEHTGTVLVVDDVADEAQMLAHMLSSDGLSVIQARSGRDALTILKDQEPDLVIMDARMPGMDGFETCRVIKQDLGLEDLPVIFMTGLDESEYVVEAFSMGAVDFITKPVIMDQLLARMRVHLGNARRTKSARHALDSTGRKIVSCNRMGQILWHTPQAQDLLTQAGIRVEPNARLPWEISDWLDGVFDRTPAAQIPGATFTYTRGETSIELRLIEVMDQADEILLRLFDCARGTDESLLAEAFALTMREAEVLLWVTHGKSNKEIGEILDVSPRTVNKHLDQVFVKVGAENRTAAATRAVKILWQDD